MSETEKEERQRGLELYLKTLANRKDTRNSLPVVEFLKLHEFCPEIMYNVPQLLIKKDFTRSKQYVNCCLFLEQHNLYVIAITDKSTRTSRFEIYSFRQTGLIQDRYKLKNPDMSDGEARQSVVEILSSPMNISRKNTFFSSIPESKDVKSAAEVRLSTMNESNVDGQNLKLDKLLACEEHPFKINAITYYEEMDMLSVGLSNGQIVNYSLEIESYAATSDTDTRLSPSERPQSKARCKFLRCLS